MAGMDYADEDRADPRAGGHADPLAGFIGRGLRAGAVASGVVVAVVATYLVLPGAIDTNAAGCAVVLSGTAVVTAGAFLLPWSAILSRRSGLLVVDGWLFVMVGSLCTAIAFTGGAHSKLFALLLVVLLFIGGPAYPLRTQALMDGAVVAGYLVAVAVTGWHLSPASLFFRVGLLVGVSITVAAVYGELTAALRRLDRERRRADRSASLWTTMATLTRRIDVPEIDGVVAAVLDGITKLGFEAADVCTRDGTEYRIDHWRGLPETYASAPHPVAAGVISQVFETRDTVVVHDYAESPTADPVLRAAGFQTVIARPLWVDGVLAGVLEAGSRRRRHLRAEEIAAFEMLAAQAGHALENARLLERRSDDAERFRTLLDASPDAMIVASPDGRVIQASRQAEALFGYRIDEMVGRPATDFMPPHSRAAQMTMANEWYLGRGTSVIGATAEEDVRVLRKDGTEAPVEVTFSTVDTPGGRVVTLALRDVTERREFEARLAHQATHDQLTGLPNRELFMEQLAGALRHPPADGVPVQVFFVDLDHVKYLNDSRGPLVGDELIVNVARRLTERLGGAFVARLGGDEFGLLVGGLSADASVRGVAQRIRDAFDSPFRVGGVEHHVTASIGISTGIVGAQADEILRNAESAVHLAKVNGRDRFEFFDQALTEAAAERLALESALHRALARDELLVAYQPVVALGSGTVVGVEALLRWKRPSVGIVSPDRFITVAEETGLIVPIGRWVLERACTQLATWSREVPGLACRMSVNVSNRQLEHDHFVEEVAAVLDATGVDPAAVVLEITESCFIRDFGATLRRLHALHRLGVRLAVDDFGTGFSSLSALSTLPVDVVKVDKVFVDGLGTRYGAVVSAVVTLARAFGLDVVAEGVESPEQRDQLLTLGCTFAQGFLFSAPLDARQAGLLLAGEAGGGRDALASADRDTP